MSVGGDSVISDCHNLSNDDPFRTKKETNSYMTLMRCGCTERHNQLEAKAESWFTPRLSEQTVIRELEGFFMRKGVIKPV